MLSLSLSMFVYYLWSQVQHQLIMLSLYVYTTISLTWSSGHGRRLVHKRSWFWISALDTGWTFFSIYLLQKLHSLFVWKKAENKKKMLGMAHYKHLVTKILNKLLPFFHGSINNWQNVEIGMPIFRPLD